MNDQTSAASAEELFDQQADRIAPAKPASRKLRLITLATVILPFAGLVAAMILLWHVAFSWVYLMLLGAMYVLTAFGVTIGFHRFFTHKSFETSKPVALILGVLGSMSIQGPLLTWVAVHRRHHHHSDDDGDPHSPHLHGDTIIATLRGFFHSHVGWMFTKHPEGLDHYVQDLRKDGLMRAVSALFPLWAVLGLLVPAALGGLLTWSWTGILLGLIWGGLVRVFIGHHLTWSVNSVCHIWGAKPFRSNDESRNNLLIGILAFGEGWHNNHHAFPTSARHGLRWWQFDLSYIVIRGMEILGLARAVRVPTADRLAAKRADHGASDLPRRV